MGNALVFAPHTRLGGVLNRRQHESSKPPALRWVRGLSKQGAFAPSKVVLPRPLFVRLKEKESDAVAEAYLRFKPILRAFIERHMGELVRRWDSADALAVDVFMETVNGLESMPGDPTEARVLARLFRVARSRMCDASRRHAREVGESGVSMGSFEDPGSRSDCDSVEEQDTRRWIHALTARLSAPHRDAVTLCSFMELSYKDASAILRINKDTLRKRHKKAIAILRVLGNPDNA